MHASTLQIVPSQFFFSSTSFFYFRLSIIEDVEISDKVLHRKPIRCCYVYVCVWHCLEIGINVHSMTWSEKCDEREKLDLALKFAKIKRDVFLFEPHF